MPVAVVCSDEAEAGRLSTDVEAFCGVSGDMLTGRDMIFYSAEGVSRETEHKRLATMYRIASGRSDLVFCTVDSLLQRSIPREKLLSSALELKMGEEYSLDFVCDLLVRAGYERSQRVEGIGQFAVRGGILDFYSPAMDDPVRCEFFGDEIDSMGYFDTETQRRSEVIKSAYIKARISSPPVRRCRSSQSEVFQAFPKSWRSISKGSAAGSRPPRSCLIRWKRISPASVIWKACLPRINIST